MKGTLVRHSFQFGSGFRSAFHKSINGSEVVRVGDEDIKFLRHTVRSKLKDAIKAVPELFRDRLGASVVELDITETKGVHHSHSGLVTGLILVSSKFASTGENVHSHGGNSVSFARHAEEVRRSVSVFLRNITLVNGSAKSCFERVLAIVLPDTLVMRFFADFLGQLMREDKVLLFDKFWRQF